jgi:hypothetical protein
MQTAPVVRPIIASIVSFLAVITVTDPSAFRYRGRFTLASGALDFAWVQAVPGAALTGPLRVDAALTLAHPDAASATIEVVGGSAAAVETTIIDASRSTVRTRPPYGAPGGPLGFGARVSFGERAA